MSASFFNQEHGGAHAWGPGELLDLSVNLNPYGPPEGLMEILREVSFRDYPDPEARRLRQQLATVYSCSSEQIAVANGANELLWAAARALLQKGDAFCCLEPCYSEFGRAARALGARAVPLRLAPSDYAACTLSQILEHLETQGASVLYLCNPNSPTGGYFAPDFIRELLRQRPQLSIILDESFLSLSHHHQARYEVYPPQVLRLVSLTKDFAIAGLRLGYALGSLAAIAQLRAQIPNWSVNSLALAAGSWCLEHEDFVAQTRPRLLEDAAALRMGFIERGLQPLSSSTIFCMLPVQEAQELAARLLTRHRILIRSCASYGWPTYWRVAARPAEDLQRFLQAFDQEIVCKN